MQVNCGLKVVVTRQTKQNLKLEVAVLGGQIPSYARVQVDMCKRSEILKRRQEEGGLKGGLFGQ